MTVTVPNSGENALEALKFELYPNAFREDAEFAPVSGIYKNAAYYAGMNYGGIAISSVENAAGFEINGEDKNILTVTLEEPLYPDEAVTLGIDFEVTIPAVNHRFGVGQHNVNLANFYPVLCARTESGFYECVYSSNGDPFVSECADYDVTLVIPEEYTAVWGGTGEWTAANGKKTCHAVFENVRDVAFVLGKELRSVSADADGVSVEYWYFSDTSPDRTLKVATDSLSYFSRTFGKYEYPRYVVVQTDFPYGGMEYPALSMISSALKESEVPAVVAHETAHQWWYAMVGNNQFEAAWQDEGLAEYSSALFLGAYPEYGGSYEEFVRRSENSYRAYYSVSSQISGEADTSMTRPLTAYSGDYEYRNLAYDKGVILFDRVRAVTGDRSGSAEV